MSDPPTAASEPQPHHRQHFHSITPANTSAKIPSPTTMAGREYHKGNWTIQETMILIAAKKLNDEQRNKSISVNLHDPDAKKGQLRWKWVENYCWNNGCRRSQNQCNDKWDNLLRDYKKIRDYESKASNTPTATVFSYWTMEKHHRKEHNLPSNMPFDVFQALNNVIQKKQHHSSVGGSGSNVIPFSSTPVAEPPLLTPAPDIRTARTSPAALERSESSSGTDSNDKHDSESKRRKVEDVGSSILQSASVLAQTLQACSEKKDKRHREVMDLERRRLQIEETRNEVNRQGITDLVAAVANLSQAVQSLVSDHQGGHS